MHQSPKTTQNRTQTCTLHSESTIFPFVVIHFRLPNQIQTNFNPPAMISIQFASNFHRQNSTTTIDTLSAAQSPPNNTNPATTKLFPTIKFELTINYHHRHHKFQWKCSISIDSALFCIVKIVSPLNADKTDQNFNFNPPNRSITSHHFEGEMASKRPQNHLNLYTQSRIPNLQTAPFPTNNYQPTNTLISSSLSLTLSRQLQPTFDCHRATNFSPNKPNSLHFPFISSGVLLQNHTTLLALKRFLCGYEAHLLQTVNN